MFRNRGIDYRFPRSTGGKFYSARIDEGASGIVVRWGPEYVPPVIPELNAEIWSWNKINTTEFGSGSILLLGNFTGSVTGSYFSGSPTYGRRTVPSVVYNFSSNFQTPRSGGLAIIQVNPGIGLPKRYEVQMSYRMYSAGAGNIFAGLYFGANQVTGSATGSFYASCITISEENAVDSPKTFNITTGSIGRVRLAPGSLVQTSETKLCHVRFLVETLSTTGSSQGPRWRVQTVENSTRNDNTALHTGYLNNSSGTNSTWVGAGTIDRFGVFFGRIASGSVAANSNDVFEIQELLIKRHPQDF